MLEPRVPRRLVRRFLRLAVVPCWGGAIACASQDLALGEPLDARPADRVEEGVGEVAAEGGGRGAAEDAAEDAAGNGDVADGGAQAPVGAAPGRPPTLEGGTGARPVTIRFRAVVGEEPFACGRSYLDAAGTRFTPADLRAFVQDVSLLTLDGDEQPVALDVRAPWQQGSVALLDFEDASGACAAGTSATNVEVTGEVPAGEYRGLVFTNGVPEALNHADPALQPPPLQAGSMSWGWLQGYRFLMAEVVATAAADAGPAGSALLHLGSTACSGNPGSGSIRCARANRNRVRLDGFEPGSDRVVLDVAPLTSGIDLRQITTCHSSGPGCAPFFERVGLDLADGSAVEGQALYRVAPAGEEAPAGEGAR